MTSSTTVEPWFVTAARVAKADLIARSLIADGVSADEAARYDDEQRRSAAAAVGKPRPSTTTWRSVVEMLAGGHAEGALCPTCGIGDPQGDAGPRKPYQHAGVCAR